MKLEDVETAMEKVRADAAVDAVDAVVDAAAYAAARYKRTKN